MTDKQIALRLGIRRERRAEQVDADDYIQKCADKAACQATLNYVESQLAGMLQAHANRPVRRNKSKLKITRSSISKYKVLPGQKLERFAGKQGLKTCPKASPTG